MLRAVVLALACAACAAFQTTSSGRTSSRVAPRMAAEGFSKSVPFLLKPTYEAGMVGDAEFDPLGLSEYFDMKFLREAEIKHGRVCMLATLGYVVQEFVHIPGEAYQNPNPLEAFTQVGESPILQIVFGMGIVEWGLNKGKMTYGDMFEDSARVPGDLGFDPLGLMKAGDPNQYALKEITHGRLAMLGISGMIQQSLITGSGVFGHS